MRQPEWTWQICDPRGQALAELTTATARSISWQRNTYAEASFSMSHEDEAAKLLLDTYYNTSPFTVGLPTLKCWRRSGRAQPGARAELLFNGYLAELDEDLSETATLTPTFRSPFARLKGDATEAGWFTGASVVFAQTDAGDIAASLISTANTLGETGLLIGSIAPSVKRDRTLQYTNVAEEILALSNMLDGFDFEEIPVDAGYKLAEFNVYARQGTDRSAQCQFGYGPDTLANVAGVRRQTIPPVNSVRIIGGNGFVGVAEDEASKGNWGRWPYQAAATDVLEQATLDARAASFIRSKPIKTINFTPELGLESCPRPIDDFWLADTVSFYARRGAFSENLKVRINGIKLVIDDNGFEATEIPDPIDPDGERILRAHLQMEATDG